MGDLRHRGLDSITELPAGSLRCWTKIHHAAIDVESRNEFIEVLHDATRRPPKPDRPNPVPERRPAGVVAAPRRAALDDLINAAAACCAAPRRPRWPSFARDLLHPERHLTATLQRRWSRRTAAFDTRRFPGGGVRGDPRPVDGASIDDAVLAVCAGRWRYLAAHAELPKTELCANAPWTIGLGTDIEDPVR